MDLRSRVRSCVKRLVNKYGTRDPERLAQELNINVLRKSYSPDTKGYFVKMLNNKFIVVNSALDEYSQKVVIAHELGHAILHSDLNINFIRENTLYPVGPLEDEANRFAAELIIDDSDIDKLTLNGMDLEELCSFFCVPKELIKFKYEII